MQEGRIAEERGDRVQMCISKGLCPFAARRQMQAYLNSRYLQLFSSNGGISVFRVPRV